MNGSTHAENLDFLKGSVLESVVIKEDSSPTLPKKITLEQPKKSKPKPKSTVKIGPVQYTSIRIDKSILKKAKLIYGVDKKVMALTEKIFLEFIAKNKKVLAQRIEEEINTLKHSL